MVKHGTKKGIRRKKLEEVRKDTTDVNDLCLDDGVTDGSDDSTL